jgi:hypothetical protein
VRCWKAARCGCATGCRTADAREGRPARAALLFVVCDGPAFSSRGGLDWSVACQGIQDTGYSASSAAITVGRGGCLARCLPVDVTIFCPSSDAHCRGEPSPFMSIRATLMADRSTVGRKSGSAFRRPLRWGILGAWRLSPQSGFGRNLFLHGEPVGAPLEPVGRAHRRAARRGAAVRARAPFHIDAWVVLPDHMHCLWTLPQGDADFPGRWRAIKIAFFQIVARCRTAIRGDGSPRRARHLAAPLLGAYDPR